MPKLNLKTIQRFRNVPTLEIRIPNKSLIVLLGTHLDHLQDHWQHIRTQKTKTPKIQKPDETQKNP